MDLERVKSEKWKIDFWSVFFSIVSLIFGAFAYIIPNQNILFLSFMILTATIGVISFYIKRINLQGINLQIIDKNTKRLNEEIIERFNYIKELNEIKRRIEFLEGMESRKSKRAQINLEDIFKIVVALILIYVIFQVIRSFSG